MQTLPCTLRQYVFQDLNFNQVDQIVCGTNGGFTEIWWFYPSEGSTWNDRYVIFNHLENAWYYGTIVRNSWLDTAIRGNPIATRTDKNSAIGYQYEHEYGVNDDASAMTSYIGSSDFDLADGEQFMLTRRMIPDVNFNESTVAGPSVTFTMTPKRFSGSAPMVSSSNTKTVAANVSTVDQYTEQVFLRARGRQMSFKVASADLGVQWQLGSVRLDVRPDGKR